MEFAGGGADLPIVYQKLTEQLQRLANRAARIDDPLLAARIQEATDLARERFFGLSDSS